MNFFLFSKLVLLFFSISTPMSAMHENFISLYNDEREELTAIISNENFIVSAGGGRTSLKDSHRWLLNSNHYEITPSQPKGPFYPVIMPSETDLDLTQIKDKPQALGVKIRIQGQIMNNQGEPISNAHVEIWQACASGKYWHPQDTNPAQEDKNFQYYGEVYTNELGQYTFATIVPGPYPATKTWWRPPHIHFKVSAKDFVETTTQLYFDGSSFKEPIAVINNQPITGDIIDQLNNDDFILQKLDKNKQKLLFVSLQKVYLNDNNEDTFYGTFNIYLKAF